MSTLVKSVMIKNVIKLESSELTELMDKYDIGCLIIINEGRPIGIITERDMLKRNPEIPE